MPSDNRRIGLTLYDHSLFLALGFSEERHGAAQIWSALSRYANHILTAGREIEDTFSREEWCLMADVLNGCADLWEFADAANSMVPLIKAEVEDAHRLNRIGAKWLDSDDADASIRDLLDRIDALTPIQGDAVLAAVRHFWLDPEMGANSGWWLVSARMPSRASHASLSPSALK